MVGGIGRLVEEIGRVVGGIGRLLVLHIKHV